MHRVQCRASTPRRHFRPGSYWKVIKQCNSNKAVCSKNLEWTNPQVVYLDKNKAYRCQHAKAAATDETGVNWKKAKTVTFTLYLKNGMWKSKQEKTTNTPLKGSCGWRGKFTVSYRVVGQPWCEDVLH